MGQLEYEAFHEVISQDCPSLSDQTEMSEHYRSHCKMVQPFITEVTYEQAFMQRSDAYESTAYFGGSFLTKSYPREIYEQGD